MNINSTNSYKRSKARKNKENLVLNKIQKERGKKQPKKGTSDLTRFMIKKKSRQKLKDSQSLNTNTLFKRFSMQIENESKSRFNINEKSGKINGLRKKMSVNYNTRDEIKKSKNQNINKLISKRRNLKSIEHSSVSEANVVKRKIKALSSNNLGLSKILKNIEKKKQEKRNEKIYIKSNKMLKQLELARKKRTLKKKAHNSKKLKDNCDQIKLSKPPLLSKYNNYTSHNPKTKRIQVKGIVRRKLSIALQMNDNLFCSKPNSPPHNLRSVNGMSPKYFKTLNKENTLHEKPSLKMVQNQNRSSSRISKADSIREKEENLKKFKLKKIDNLKRILTRKRKQKEDQNRNGSITSLSIHL
jgi:hypothetical protein